MGHEKNTFKERTNKYLELDRPSQESVSKIAQNTIERVFRDTEDMNVNVMRQHFKQSLFQEVTNLQAIILFLEKERDAYKRQVK